MLDGSRTGVCPSMPLLRTTLKCNAALFDLMISGRLVLIDEGSEVERRRADPGLKCRSQAASKKEFKSSCNMTSWREYRAQ
eukprot:8934009-Pyramimonas_sp.AAC.1